VPFAVIGFFFKSASLTLQVLKEVDNSFAAITQNSINRVEDYESIKIPWDVADNIRLGTPPKTAVKLLNSEWPPK
jgi:hypothetical protein